MQEKHFNQLFKEESGKMASVLCKIFGLEHLDAIEDAIQESFISAFQTWKLRGLPDNPSAWLYRVAKNKILNQIQSKKNRQRILDDNRSVLPTVYILEAKWEEELKFLEDNTLQMLFAICHPKLSEDFQSALALKILCGFTQNEIANAFLTSVETIQKRIYRAKQQIHNLKIQIQFPNEEEIENRIESVVKVLYLLFSQGYYSNSGDHLLRTDLIRESLRLSLLLSENEKCAKATVFALIALISFHSSRLESRKDSHGTILSWNKQNPLDWNQELISKGKEYLTKSLAGSQGLKFDYQVEALIALIHTEPDFPNKWNELYTLYSQLFHATKNPMVNWNRIYTLFRASGAEVALAELDQFKDAPKNQFSELLRSKIWEGIDSKKSEEYFQSALLLCGFEAERNTFRQNRDS
ncbi:sigma-70 family RNA polymerase sigma factor [Leptospira yanagawae]|uniref:Sigma-70 family RNA polymerase sigma factor n=1 Tax=Leptospira yanagawae TaxID=293069 RepID=A0ABY2M4J6_9LEPT|nr:sigma-70 family RNA polymerase sigma factor [Leptospira yanagawae]TGL21056.1 sigma-70 family RNA polymerase sigma factor [Leptospira yanagawae]